MLKDEEGAEEQEQVNVQLEVLQKQLSENGTRKETFLELVHGEDESIRDRKEAATEVEAELKEKRENEREKKRGVPSRRKTRAQPKIAAKTEEGDKRKKSHKKKIRTLTLTGQDFESVRRRRRFTSDAREFDEFDEERNGAPSEKFHGDEEGNAGIAVADLPFKPAIDVYDLERVSGEEFCPLTLEDDPSCEETRGWP